MLQSYLDQTLSFFRLAPLLISEDSFNELLVRLDCFVKNNSEPEHYSKIVAEQIQSYQEKCDSIFLTTDYDDRSIPDSLAVHYIDGFISHDKNWWYASTEQLLEDIEAAELNEKIIGHLLIINSPGGESYNLENVNKQIRALNKPVISAVKKTMCSAGLYLGVAADKVYCVNRFDVVGSIGTMISYWDCKKAMEQYGWTLVEAYATKSTHKNKINKDVEEGKTDEFIKRFLDPIQEEFEKTVRHCRPKASESADEAHVFNGEIFYAEEAIQFGLIDGVKSMDEIITELYQLGKEYQTRSKISIT